MRGVKAGAIGFFILVNPLMYDSGNSGRRLGWRPQAVMLLPELEAWAKNSGDNGLFPRDPQGHLTSPSPSSFVGGLRIEGPQLMRYELSYV